MEPSYNKASLCLFERIVLWDCNIEPNLFFFYEDNIEPNLAISQFLFKDDFIIEHQKNRL